MNYLIIGNALCFIASIIMLLIGLIKNKTRFLASQCVMNAVFIAGNSFLGGWSGAVANAVTMVRNIVCIRFTLTRTLKIVFIALQVAITALIGADSILAWLPVFANCVFTWFMDSENMILLKAVVIVSQAMWLVYDFSIMNYATVLFDFGACITNAVALVSLAREKKAS